MSTLKKYGKIVAHPLRSYRSRHGRGAAGLAGAFLPPAAAGPQQAHMFAAFEDPQVETDTQAVLANIWESWSEKDRKDLQELWSTQLLPSTNALADFELLAGLWCRRLNECLGQLPPAARALLCTPQGNLYPLDRAGLYGQEIRDQFAFPINRLLDFVLTIV